MSRLDALLLSTPLIAVMVVLCAVLLFQRRGRNRRRNCYLREPYRDARSSIEQFNRIMGR